MFDYLSDILLCYVDMSGEKIFLNSKFEIVHCAKVRDQFERLKSTYSSIDMTEMPKGSNIEASNRRYTFKLDIANIQFDKLYVKDILHVKSRYNNIFIQSNLFSLTIFSMTRVFKNKVWNSFPETFILLNKSYINRDFVDDASIELKEVHKTIFQKNYFLKDVDSQISFHFNDKKRTRFSRMASTKEIKNFINYYKIKNKQKLIESCKEA